jgi:sialidase-1
MIERVLILLAPALAALAADPVLTDLYVGGEGGYHSYRIPALLATKKGTLLAFCEARKNSARDDGDIDLVLRRSSDGGNTWSAMTVVHEEGGDAPITIGNPSPVQDRKTGVIHLVFARNNQRVFQMQSRDEGATWSGPVELTDALRPFDFAWTRVGIGPGHAIQLRGGRLLVPVWLNDRIKGNYRSAAMYSDDAGATWKAGGIVPPAVATNANECMLYERRDGAVVVSLRSAVHQRHTAISRDGGLTWSEPKPVDGVVDPVCQASILALPKGRVFFANPASEKRRIDMTLRLSKDDGATWPVARRLYEGPSGYSDLAAAKDGTIFCMFESGAKAYNDRIRFAKIPPGWLRP